MDSEGDSFQKYLANRSKNLLKKLEKIPIKKELAKNAEKALDEAELKLLSSKPLIESQLEIIEEVAKLYTDCAPSKNQPTPKQQCVDNSGDVVALWVVSEFVNHPDIVATLDQEEKELLEALNTLTGCLRGTAGDSFESLRSSTHTMTEKYVSKSQSEVPHTAATYFTVAEFVENIVNSRGLTIRPVAPLSKSELVLQTSEVLSGNVALAEPRHLVSKWAEEEPEDNGAQEDNEQAWDDPVPEDPWKEEKKAEEAKNTQEEEEFINVKGRKRNKPHETHAERRGMQGARRVRQSGNPPEEHQERELNRPRRHRRPRHFEGGEEREDFRGRRHRRPRDAQAPRRTAEPHPEGEGDIWAKREAW